MSEAETLTLWEVLRARGTDSQRQTVQDLLAYAAPILDRIIETFRPQQ